MLFDGKHCWQCFLTIFCCRDIESVVLRVVGGTGETRAADSERTGAVALGALCGGLKGRQAAKKAAKAESDLKDYCRNNLCSKWQSEPQQVAQGRYSMPPRNIIAPEHCPDVCRPPSSVLRTPSRPQDPLAQNYFFFYTLSNLVAEPQNQAHMQ